MDPELMVKSLCLELDGDYKQFKTDFIYDIKMIMI